MSEVVLKENAMTRVGPSRIGCGNLWDRDYTLSDGSTASGMSARLAIAGDAIIVGVGSELVIGGIGYRVVAIDKAPGLPGRVRLQRTV